MLGTRGSGAHHDCEKPDDGRKRTEQRDSLCKLVMKRRGGTHLPPKEETAEWSTVDGDEVAVMAARRRDAADLRGVAPFRTDSSGER